MIELILFLALSIFFIIISWPSLHNWHTHGFYRFFVFEILSILFLLNVHHWFTKPFSIHQIASWFLLTASLVLVAQGFYLLRKRGRPKGKIENTASLVKQGIYRYIRHPLYSSLLLFGWGVYMKAPSFLGAILVGSATALLVLTAKVEEQENIQKFGREYETYRSKTKMFIPFIF